MTIPITVIVDSRIRLPPGLPTSLVDELRAAFCHSNPDFFKKERLGIYTGNISKVVETWGTGAGGGLTFPRGGTKKVRRILAEHGYAPLIRDNRVRAGDPRWDVKQSPEWPPNEIELHWYQEEAKQLCISTEQGLVRAPTGGGKTILGLAVAAHLRQPTLVVMRDSHLLDQWMDEAVKKFNLHPNEIGVITGSKRKLRIGARLTLALQQSLSSASFPADEVNQMIGCFMVDEVQQVAARTFLLPVDSSPARYRIGLSADETRKDRKEFLIYDQFGEVLYEIPRDVLEEEGFVVPVIVRLVPTEFRADWYRDAEVSEKDFGRLLEEMVADEAREHILVKLVRTLVEDKHSPLFVFSQRKEHAGQLADTKLFNAGVRCGLMIGGNDNATRFKEDKSSLLDGSLPVAAGTFHALGVGLNIPRVRAGVMALPMGSNKQFFNQVRGRVCRSAPGKEDAFLYILWDRHVFPHLPKVVRKWNRGRTQVLSEDGLWTDV